MFESVLAGATTDFFDQIYYPCLDDTSQRPYGLYVHGNQGTEGAGPGRRIDHQGNGLGAGERSGGGAR